MREPAKKQFTDFMCRCSQESEVEAQECLDRVKALLEASDDDLLTKVVYGLHWGLPEGYSAAIGGFMCDQWCGVTGSVFCYQDGKDVEVASVFVQCDRVEDGVARAYELCVEACT